jgi:Holin of 3TMs, for gene-transfer release
MFPLEALLGIGNKLIDHFFPDANQAAEAKLKLLEMQQNGQLAQLNADISEQNNVSDRWKADAASDSQLAKNIRPLTLVYILTAYVVFAIADGYGYKIASNYVELLGQWGMLVMSAYFGGRTLEKIMDIRSKKDDSTK